MSRRRRRRRRLRPPQVAPGVLLPDPSASPTRLHLMIYGPDSLEEIQDASLEQVQASQGRGPVRWLHVEGFENVDLLRALGEQLGLHSLVVAGLGTAPLRAHMEEHSAHDELTLRRPTSGDEDAPGLIQLWNSELLVSFAGRPYPGLDAIRKRLRDKKGVIRSRAPDHLACALADLVVGEFYKPLEALEEELDRLEGLVVSTTPRGVLEEIYKAKRELLSLRRRVAPMREVLNLLAQGESERVSPRTLIYFRSARERCAQLLDGVEAGRDTANSLMDLTLSKLSQRLNEVMRVLTLISTIFIPLSFVVGLYGMNFDRGASPWNMPELGWRYGYPLVLSLMASLSLGMLWFFHRRGWLGEEDSLPSEDSRAEEAAG